MRASPVRHVFKLSQQSKLEQGLATTPHRNRLPCSRKLPARPVRFTLVPSAQSSFLLQTAPPCCWTLSLLRRRTASGPSSCLWCSPPSRRRIRVPSGTPSHRHLLVSTGCRSWCMPSERTRFGHCEPWKVFLLPSRQASLTIASDTTQTSTRSSWPLAQRMITFAPSQPAWLKRPLLLSGGTQRSLTAI